MEPFIAHSTKLDEKKKSSSSLKLKISTNYFLGLFWFRKLGPRAAGAIRVLGSGNKAKLLGTIGLLK